MWRIETANPEYTGVVAGVQITNGVGETDDPTAVSYFERHGATLTDLNPEETAAEIMEVETSHLWPEGEPSEKWRTAEIDAYAEARGIDLSGAGNKAEKVEVIRAYTAN